MLEQIGRLIVITLYYYSITGIFELVSSYTYSILNHCSDIIMLDGNRNMSTSNI